MKGEQVNYILGISGGLDSCYSAYIAYKKKLSVTLININGGWGIPQADENIRAIAQYTDYPLYVYGMPESLTDLRRAFLKADVLHAETPADIAYQKMLYDAAKTHKADCIISGMNNLEGNMPSDFSVIDSRYIKSVWKRFGDGDFPNDFPMLSMWEYYKYKKMIWRILDGINYNPAEALQELKHVGFEYYSGKHLEDRFTAFNQGLRFWKFGVDVRYVNYKAMIRENKMTLAEMYNTLKEPPYPIEKFWELAKEVEARIGVTIDAEFMTRPMRSWTEFKTWRNWIKLIKKFWKYETPY